MAAIPLLPPALSPALFAMASRLKHFAKKLVGADKDPHVGVVTSADFIKANKISPVAFILHYLRSLFPILGWIGKYNLGWLSGDLVAGERLLISRF